MRHPQFTLRALLVVMLAVGCFFGGIRFERERRRREDAANELAVPHLSTPPLTRRVLAEDMWDDLRPIERMLRSSEDDDELPLPQDRIR